MGRIYWLLFGMFLIGLGVVGLITSALWSEAVNDLEYPQFGEVARQIGVPLLILGISILFAPMAAVWLGSIWPWHQSVEEEAEQVKQAYLMKHSPTGAKKLLCGALGTEMGRFRQWGRGLLSPHQEKE